jgi:hypothetical protein
MQIKKPFYKINFEDIDIASEFFDHNQKHLSEFIMATIAYYSGKNVEIKSKLVEKYFKTYKKTMDAVIVAKGFGLKGAELKAEKQLDISETLEGGVEDTLTETLPTNNKEVIIKDKKEIEIIKDCKNNVFTESLNDFNKWIELWERWKKYKYEQHKDKYKSQDSENTAAKKLLQYSNNDYSIGLHIVEKSIANGYKGFFEIKKDEMQLIKPTEYIKKPFVSNNPYLALCDSQPCLSDRLKKQEYEF